MKKNLIFKIERRPVASGSLIFFVSLIAIFIALAVAGIFFRIYGVSPFELTS